MCQVAVAVLAAAAAAGPALDAAASAPAPPGLVELEGRPLRVAALETGSRVEVLLLQGPELVRFRLEGRGLARTGAFRAPSGDSRPLLVDAAADPAGGDPLVTAVFGEDVQSVDEGADTRLHAFVLSAGEDGGLRPVSDDLGAWLRIAGGMIRVQRRGLERMAAGPVRRVDLVAGRYVPGAEVPWAGRWLLDATPLPGGTEAVAWDGGRPTIVLLQGGARVPGGTVVSDLGSVGEPSVAIRVDRPMLRGIDAAGRGKDMWHPLPRRVRAAAGGAFYTLSRQRSKPFLGRASGQDGVVRLDWSGGSLALSRPYPGVDAFALDFALVERPGGRTEAILLVSDAEDGSGRASLLFQEPRVEPRP